MAKYWLGDPGKLCQLCNRPFRKAMYDCQIPFDGRWGNICRNCFLEYGCSLGTGYGQQYELQENGKWLKVGG